MRTSKHAKNRIVERDSGVDNRADARKMAKLAFQSGATINDFHQYPGFFSYLTSRRDESSTCKLRVYRGNIYLWKGSSRTLVTCHPIPDRFIEEMRDIDERRGSI